jgi:hypothetical protein
LRFNLNKGSIADGGPGVKGFFDVQAYSLKSLGRLRNDRFLIFAMRQNWSGQAGALYTVLCYLGSLPLGERPGRRLLA